MNRQTTFTNRQTDSQHIINVECVLWEKKTRNSNLFEDVQQLIIISNSI